MVFYAPHGGCIIKADKDVDLYIRWSTICDGTDPEFIGTRSEFLEAGYESERLDRADVNGSSSMVDNFGHWDDSGFVVQVRREEFDPEEVPWLPRNRLADYARMLRERRYDEAEALIEKLDPDT